ncbi:hypothetical protein BH10PSE2_BH10PSE2_13300 [soil metagenome]
MVSGYSPFFRRVEAAPEKWEGKMDALGRHRRPGLIDRAAQDFDVGATRPFDAAAGAPSLAG